MGSRPRDSKISHLLTRPKACGVGSVALLGYRWGEPYDIDSLLESRRARFITRQTLVPWAVGFDYLQGTRYEIKEGRLTKERLVEERSLRVAFPLLDCPITSTPYSLTARDVIKEFSTYFRTYNPRGKSLVKASPPAYLHHSLQRFGLLDQLTNTGSALFSDSYYVLRWIHKRWGDTLCYIRRHLPEDLLPFAPTWYTSAQIDHTERRVQGQRAFWDPNYVFASAASTEQEICTENYYLALWFIYHGNLITWYTLTRFFDYFVDQHRSNLHSLRSSVYWIRAIPKWTLLSSREKAIAVLEFYLQKTINAALPNFRWDKSFRFTSAIDQELALLIHIRFRTCSYLFDAVVELFQCFITANISEPLIVPRRLVLLLESDSDSDGGKASALITAAATRLEHKLPLPDEHFWFHSLGKIYNEHILPYVYQPPSSPPSPPENTRRNRRVRRRRYA